MTEWLHNMEWVLAIRSDALTPVFKAFSALGYGGFYLLFLPIGYWVISKRMFTRLGLLLMISSLLNAYLKDLFQDPRPDPMFRLDPAVGESFGFPSGHAQIAVTTWLWLAWDAGKKWVWVLAWVLVGGICFSRLYLGVHDPADVLGGLGIGFVLLAGFAFLNRKRHRWPPRLHPAWQLAAIALLTGGFFLTWPGRLSPDALGYGLFLLGFWTGVILDRSRLFFEKRTERWRIASSGILGILGFMALHRGLSSISALSGDFGPLIGIIQALLLGFYIPALAPWMLQRMGLAARGGGANAPAGPPAQVQNKAG